MEEEFPDSNDLNRAKTLSGDNRNDESNAAPRRDEDTTDIPLLEIMIRRRGNIIEIEGTGASVTFDPKNKDKTLRKIIEKAKELGQDVTGDSKDAKWHRHSLDIQLTEIYSQHAENPNGVNSSKAEIPRTQQSLGFIKGKCKRLFVDQYGAAFASVEIGDHIEVLPINQDRFKHWAAKGYYEEYGDILNQENISNVLNILNAEAEFSQSRQPMHLRVAWSDTEQDTIYYDLSNDKHEAVKITKQGWEVVSNPQLFYRYRNQKPQVYPARQYRKNIFDEFFKLANIADDDSRTICKAYMSALLIPDIPKPVFMPYGEQGSAKSTCQELIKDTLDPCVALSFSIPRDTAELAQILFHNHIVYFDNISHINDTVSNELCRAATGSGFSKRKLFTDQDDVIFAFRRAIGFNGINVAATRADLLERGIAIHLDRIEDSKRKKIVEIWHEHALLKSELLGRMLDILVQVLNRQAEFKVAKSPRMSDFAEVGELILQCMGEPPNKFLDAYYRNIGLQTSEAIEAHPVATAIMQFMDSRDSWTGTASQLLEELEVVAVQLKMNTQRMALWPKAPNSLSRRLNEVITNLREAGLDIYRKKSSNNTPIIEIRKVSPASPTSPAPTTTAAQSPTIASYCNTSKENDAAAGVVANTNDSGDDGDFGDTLRASSSDEGIKT